MPPWICGLSYMYVYNFQKHIIEWRVVIGMWCRWVHIDIASRNGVNLSDNKPFLDLKWIY